jgi:hypothetical protein
MLLAEVAGIPSIDNETRGTDSAAPAAPSNAPDTSDEDEDEDEDEDDEDDEVMSVKQLVVVMVAVGFDLALLRRVSEFGSVLRSVDEHRSCRLVP